MPMGPGKYDDLCTYVREQSNAQGAAVIIFNGDRGVGFSVQADQETTMAICDVLEHMAKDIRKSLLHEQYSELIHGWLMGRE